MDIMDKGKGANILCDGKAIFDNITWYIALYSGYN